MTLFKQIVLMIVFFQLLTLSVVVYQNFHAVNEQIQNRVFSDAQESAISLGLSISQVALKPEAGSMIETMINAIFDSGYYQSITLKDLDGKVIYMKQNPKVVHDVPQWFVDYVSFDTHAASTEIMAGWQQFGVLEIVNHNGHVYKQLWELFNTLLFWYLIIVVFSIAMLFALLRWLFKPLSMVQRQAEAITYNEFIINDEHIPTTELKEVTHAMNAMVRKVHAMVERDTGLLDRYNALMYFDQQYKVGNRALFLQKMGTLLSQNDIRSFGVAGLINFSHIEALKNRYGYEAYKSYVLAFLDEMQTQAKAYDEEALVCRFTQNSYAFIIPSRRNVQHAQAIGEHFTKILTGCAARFFEKESDPFFVMGLSCYDASMDVKTMMSHLDYALLQASHEAHQGFVLYSKQSEIETLLKKGREAWIQTISKAIKNNDITPLAQPCMDTRQNMTHHWELFSVMRLDDDHTLRADFFLPIAKYARQLEALDRYLFQEAARYREKMLALNLSVESMVNTEFLGEIEHYANRLATKRLRPNIMFEVNLNIIDAKEDQVAQFCKSVKRYGYAFGIDHFRFDAYSIDLIAKVAPSYIKICAQQLVREHNERDDFNMIQSVRNIAATYDLVIIADYVESEQHKTILNKYGIHLIQGAYIHEATPL